MDEDFEYIDRLRNKNRKKMLVAIYEKTQHYAELTELTGLKPGSIYHHLKVLQPMITKEGQGLYRITELGKKIVEKLELVEIESQKPNIKVKATKISKEDDILETIWLSKFNQILIVFIFMVSILLASQGVALAGSAIYSVSNWSVILFDLFALLLGWGALYMLEFITPSKIYSEKYFPLTIRLISMLPGSIVGLGLYLLFLTGTIISATGFIILFAITTVLGLLIGASGEYYLRSQTISNSVKFVAVPVFIDILLGLAIIITL